MAFKRGMKRAMKATGGDGVAKKCHKIAKGIRSAETLPQPVRAILCDTLVRTFKTYKEDRHPFQVAVSTQVGKALKDVQDKLQGSIAEAQAKKAAVDAEAASLLQKSDADHAASEAAATALGSSKTALADSKTALKDAKSALHELEAASKAQDAAGAAASAKKGKLEALSTDFVTPVREGAKHGATAGKHVGGVLGGCSDLESEFIGCVTATFSKASSAWGSFDKIIDGKVEGHLKALIASFGSEAETITSGAEARAAGIEGAKAAIVAAEEKVKAADEACTGAGTAAKEADTVAKASAAALKQQQGVVAKAADAIKDAEEALASFQNGALAAYTEVEARVAPPPEPEQPAETAPLVDAAMEAAPAAADRKAPSLAASPGILLQRAAQAVGLSPRVASS